MTRLIIFALSVALFSANAGAQTQYPVAKGERWYAAIVNEGHKMPFTAGYRVDLNGDAKGNQAAPLLLSDRGNTIWSEEPFAFEIGEDKIVITDHHSEIIFANGGKTLKEATLFASESYFPPQNKLPDPLFFTSPQYNTWIELGFNQTQKGILKYAHDLIDNGFPPGVLMIDDNWAPYYGLFEFRKDRFDDAKAMIDELHGMGFKVMLWVSPFIGADTDAARYLRSRKLVLMSSEGASTWEEAINPAVVRWWNGYSLVLDFSNPGAVEWYRGQLDGMVEKYGLDGFKFDAGDPEFYTGATLSYGNVSGNEQCRLWGEFGLEFPLNEYRSMWKGGGLPLVERLRDKLHTWEDVGKLIPHITVAGMSGYAFCCPDMIGGGEMASFLPGAHLEQKMVVRSAQCHALMPMMQFSVAPWRVLDKEHFDAVKKVVELREKFVPYIMRLAEKSASTGEPIVSNMEYSFPGQGLAECRDQFMLGDSILVAPVVTAENIRTVTFPVGRWADANGKTVKGPAVREYDVALDELLWFRKTK